MHRRTHTRRKWAVETTARRWEAERSHTGQGAVGRQCHPPLHAVAALGLSEGSAPVPIYPLNPNTVPVVETEKVVVTVAVTMMRLAELSQAAKATTRM